VKLGTNAQHDLKELSERLMLHNQRLPPGLTADGYLLVLLEVLSTINALFFSIGPLTSGCWKIRPHASETGNDRNGASSPSSTENVPGPSGVMPTITKSNPYVPLTADREFNRLGSKLSRSLDTWQLSFEASGLSQEATVQAERGAMLPLLYFSKLLLEAGPCIFVLPSLAGYDSPTHISLPVGVSFPCPPHKIGILISELAIEHAVGILETVESQRIASSRSKAFSDKQRRISPMWYPFALFYGALVVWVQTEMHASRKYSQHTLHSFRRLSQSFYEELKMIEADWDCVRQMSEVVKKLTA
jgi:hypothetical protein